MNANGTSSTRPYLIRALYEWCSDNGLTPYVAVRVDDTVRVPREYVKDGEIVLNVSMDATSALKLGNDYIEFRARFAGVPRDIMIPVARVMAIYARENGQGMAFPLDDAAESETAPVDADGVPGGVTAPASGAAPAFSLSSIDSGLPGGEDPEPPKSGGATARPALKRVK
jgi:stringent starvation protein B